MNEQDVWRSQVEDYTPEERVRLVKCADRLREALAGRPQPLEILDIGCGCGPMGQFLPGPQFRLSGIELDDRAAEQARRHYAEVVVQDLTAPWPFADARFDGLLALAVLEHVVDYRALLRQAARVLKPGGCFIVEVPNLGYWKEVRKLLLRKQPHWLRQYDHVRGWTLRYLQDALAEHGFVTVGSECDRLNLPLVPASRWLERRLASWGRVLIVQLAKPDGKTAPCRE
ncbi:MAG: class I SAM-dependent methyltransferase [Planctomycetes bacterium]|nr:class I SAM-dependent methyltransferase [Planctomycetota bacterium]